MATATNSTRTVRVKEFQFPLTIEWMGGRRVAAKVEGKQPVEIAPPPVFRGTDPTAWSPEDFLVAADASCLAVTFTGLAEREGLSYSNLRVDATGICGRRDDGHFGFTRLLLQLTVETDPADAARARALAETAEQNCLISASLDVPVETVINTKPNPRPRR
jgi:organic hydroperoxide reductase OsmC/OhrA